MKNVFWFLIFAIFLSSCASPKKSNQKTKIREITNLAYFEPLAFVGLIQKDNLNTLNDSVSMISKKLLETAILQSTNNKVHKKITVNDPKIREKINKELSYLFQKILNYNKIANVKITPTIDSVLKNNNQRFVLATVTDGFVKIETAEVQNNNDIFSKPISTLDLLVEVRNKPILTLHALIIDNEKGNVIFYDHTHPVYKQPTDKKNIEKQYQKLFKGYYHN